MEEKNYKTKIFLHITYTGCIKKMVIELWSALASSLSTQIILSQSERSGF